MNEFPEVLEKGMGHPRGIELKDGAQPKFCKYRPVSFAVMAQVEEAIRQKVEDGELKLLSKVTGQPQLLLSQK